MTSRRRRRSLGHERRILLLALGAGLPAVVACLVLLAWGGYAPKVQWTFGALVVSAWLGFASAARNAVVRPLQTLSNLLGALREEDFSFRARGARPDDALGEVMIEVNALADTLRSQRLGALEATALLRKVMEEIDVAVFAFDGAQRLRLVNRAGERVLGQPAERLLELVAVGPDPERRAWAQRHGHARLQPHHALQQRGDLQGPEPRVRQAREAGIRFHEPG